MTSGRHTKLTKKLMGEIVAYIRDGNYAETAAECCGISERSYYEYLSRGKEDILQGKNTIFAQFSQAIKKARAYAESEALKHIREAAINRKIEGRMVLGQWQAAAWYLERTNSKKWGNRQQQEIISFNISSDDLKFVNTEELEAYANGELSPEQLQQIIIVRRADRDRAPTTSDVSGGTETSI